MRKMNGTRRFRFRFRFLSPSVPTLIPSFKFQNHPLCATFGQFLLGQSFGTTLPKQLRGLGNAISLIFFISAKVTLTVPWNETKLQLILLSVFCFPLFTPSSAWWAPGFRVSATVRRIQPILVIPDTHSK